MLFGWCVDHYEEVVARIDGAVARMEAAGVAPAKGTLNESGLSSDELAALADQLRMAMLRERFGL